MTASSTQGPVVALTGTPGTGKSQVAAILDAKGQRVLALSRFVGDPRFDRGSDGERDGTHILDETALDAHLRENLHEELGDAARDSAIFVESHMAHALTFVDRIIVLRCRPSVLRKRLEKRGYSQEKIRENLEAEGMDLILQEALQTRDAQRRSGHVIAVAQVDTTEKTAEESAQKVLELATTASANLEIDRVDWSDEVLGWY